MAADTLYLCKYTREKVDLVAFGNRKFREENNITVLLCRKWLCPFQMYYCRYVNSTFKVSNVERIYNMLGNKSVKVLSRLLKVLIVCVILGSNRVSEERDLKRFFKSLS